MHPGLLYWEDRYLLGVSSIDEQHQRIFGLTHNLQVALYQGSSDSTLSILLKSLIIYTANHFAHEEALLSFYKFENSQEHIGDHLRFLQTAQQLLTQTGECKTSAVQMGEIIADWASAHILEFDQKIAAFLRGHGLR